MKTHINYDEINEARAILREQIMAAAVVLGGLVALVCWVVM